MAYAEEVNYLAHLHLSGNDRATVIGNFIADGVRGNESEAYSREIQEGIKHHRAIDHFTDTHPVVHRSKMRLRPRFRKYAPVIVDVFYDHFLARNWSDYHDENLRDFIDRMIHLLDESREVFPPKSARLLDFAAANDLFFRYGTVEGMDLAFRGLARRTRFESGMESASNELRENGKAYEKEFQRFYPELVEKFGRLG